MTQAALVRTDVSPPEIVGAPFPINPDRPRRLEIPGGYTVSPAEIGWRSPAPRDDAGHFITGPRYLIAEYREEGAKPGRFHVQGELSEPALSGTVVTRTRQWSAPDLAQLKDRLLRQVDATAGEVRSRYITVTPGQEMTYSEKARQARGILADADPAPAAYPMIAALVGIRGGTLRAVADLVVAKEAEWQQLGAAIEGTREGAKVAIVAAETRDDALAIFDAIAWPGTA